MNPGAYLDAVRRRLERRRSARLAALGLTLLLAVTALGGLLVMLTVPAAGTLAAVRVLLYGALALGLVLAIRGHGRVRTALELEHRVPQFGGRLLTWRDAAGRAHGSPLLPLLTRETAAVAAAHPPERVVASREVLIPGLLALAAALGLALLLVGSQPLQLAAQRLWTGSLLAGAQPRIVVSPGDAVVRRGSDVVVEAVAHGFRPADMAVNADFGSGWESAPMAELGDGSYGFVLVGVTGPVAYYVADRGLTSARHRIQVADLPEVIGVATRYRFPDWTGLPEQTLAGGDVTALAETEVSVTVQVDRPVSELLLVVNGTAVPMTVVAADDGADDAAARARGSFRVAAAGDWHVAVRHGAELARISERFLIDLAEDAAPELAYVWPGHDRKATPIEEVALAFQATDDYGVESLLLRYSINGGDWHDVALDDGDHLLRLEELRAVEDGERRRLLPGDVISLHAEARDHRQRTRSALYFIDIRPFELRYRESQQMAGQGGAEGGDFDIAERQRDILTATWNLINKHEDGERTRGGLSDAARQALADEGEVLAMLQRTLAGQVETLIARSTARGLGRGGEASAFIHELSQALEHMEPAAERLAAAAPAEAVPAEQRALRHLTTAEASVREVDVSLARNQGRGSSGRSLRELVELEMDPRRNRYEMPQQAGLDNADPQSPDTDWRRLDELAGRQEQLAARADRAGASLPSRWEQARLLRELEQLRADLEAGAASAAGSAGQPSPTAGAGASALEGALGEVDRARQDLASGAALDPERQRQAAEALRRAAQRLRDASQGALEDQLGRVGRNVDNLRADQRRVMEALQDLQREALNRAREGEAPVRGEYRMQTFADLKRRMQSDLAELRGELVEIGAAADGSEATRILDRALRELDDVRMDERLAASADAFDMGQPLYVIGSETLVEQAFDRLGRRLEQARRAVQDGHGGEPGDPLAELADLRRRLAGARGADGSVDRAAVESVAGAVERVAARVGGRGVEDGGAALGAASSGAGRESGGYRIRGVAAENTETLLRMTLDRLDLLEAGLWRRDAAPIRAQEPRAASRDSSAAARYFRSLSRTADEE